MKLNIKTKQTLLLLLFLIFLLILVVTILELIKTNSECVQNPLVYGAKQFKNAGMELLCSCTPTNPHYNPIMFDANNITVVKDVYLP